jgi:hypothetical protein
MYVIKVRNGHEIISLFLYALKLNDVKYKIQISKEDNNIHVGRI